MKEFKEYLEAIQSTSKEGINFEHKFAMVQSGGSIGERKGYSIDRKMILFTSDNKEELEAKVKNWNKQRTTGEKSFYKIKYSVVPLVKSKVKEK